MGQLTNLYKNRCIQLQEQINYLEQILNESNSSIVQSKEDRRKAKNFEEQRKKRGGYDKFEKLDPVGKEDEDINNDGKTDSTDKYLRHRRQVIGRNMSRHSGNHEKMDLEERMLNYIEEQVKVLEAQLNEYYYPAYEKQKECIASGDCIYKSVVKRDDSGRLILVNIPIPNPRRINPYPPSGYDSTDYDQGFDPSYPGGRIPKPKPKPFPFNPSYVPYYPGGRKPVWPWDPGSHPELPRPYSPDGHIRPRPDPYQMIPDDDDGGWIIPNPKPRPYWERTEDDILTKYDSTIDKYAYGRPDFNNLDKYGRPTYPHIN